MNLIVKYFVIPISPQFIHEDAIHNKPASLPEPEIPYSIDAPPAPGLTQLILPSVCLM